MAGKMEIGCQQYLLLTLVLLRSRIGKHCLAPHIIEKITRIGADIVGLKAFTGHLALTRGTKVDSPQDTAGGNPQSPLAPFAGRAECIGEWMTRISPQAVRLTHVSPDCSE